VKRYKIAPAKLTGHPGIDAERLREQREFEERMAQGVEWKKAQARDERIHRPKKSPSPQTSIKSSKGRITK
jgi:hypothetical protein